MPMRSLGSDPSAFLFDIVSLVFRLIPSYEIGSIMDRVVMFFIVLDTHEC